MSTNPAPTSSAQTPRKSPKRAAVGAWIGSALEYYDFFVYATAASIVFPKIFFPQADPAVGVIGSLATFGVGYVARPLGAIFMGWWGDTRGRKSVLVLTLWIMGISTFLVGCLPTYSQIGVWAPILLVALRLAQGIGVSGEQAGANAMVLEHAPDHRRAFYTSFTLNGTQGGQIISTAIFLPLAASMSDEALLAYGWRIPFWLSALVMIVAYLIRRNIDETPTFREVVEKDVDRVSPLVEAFRGHKANMLRVILMCFINSVSVTLGIFALAFATNAAYGNSLSTTAMLWVGVLVNVIAVVAIPLWALLADAVGRRPVFIFAGLSCAVLMWLYLHFIDVQNITMVFVVGLSMSGVCYSAYSGTFPAFFNELFPPRLRVTAVAVSTQVGFGLTGFLPTLAAVLAPPGSNVVLIVGTLVTVCCIISAAAVFSARETGGARRGPLAQPVGEAPRAGAASVVD
jgi:MFS family permease